jgi:anti-sigma regulatory factor (Ser/Thr protein kinase)
VTDEHHVAIGSDADLVLARRKGRELATEIGFSRAEATLVATAISELARNILAYAGDGHIALRTVRHGEMEGVAIVALDSGPGIVDVDAALQEGSSTTGGLGVGLPGARRLMDEFEIESEVGKGTRIEMTKWRRSSARPRILEWGVATWTLPGQLESGDAAVVKPFPHGALAAAVDGLGHGQEAAGAARIARDVLERSAGAPLNDIVERSHRALQGTRGAVMSLASFDARVGTMTWLGVGNVEAILVPSGGEASPRSLMIPRAGIVGYRLPPLAPTVMPIRQGDTLIFATDGVSSDFAEEQELDGSPAHLAEWILDKAKKRTDDALVLVGRYIGEDR